MMAESIIKRCEQAVLALFPENTTLQAYYGPDDYEIIDETALVRAVLKAMREPTSKMLAAAAAAMSPEKRRARRFSVKQKHRIRYHAMIDKALEDG